MGSFHELYKKLQDGLIVDIIAQGWHPTSTAPPFAEPQMLEVKTVRFSAAPSSVYAQGGMPGQPCRPAVVARAGTVPAEYERRADKADETFCRTPRGQEGPIRRALDAMATVVALVFGSKGETTESTIHLAKAAALVGAHKHSVRSDFNLRGVNIEQAAALLSWYMLRRWGRLAMLMDLQVRQRALEAVAGSWQQRASRGGAPPRAGVADEFWAQRETKADRNPTFRGFGAAMGGPR